jgi:lysophospholipase L1-like esterase
VPGAVDYVITPSDLTAINNRMAQMNAHIQSKATQNGYAYFTLGSLYDLSKGSLDMYNVLFSSSPFGSNFSLDGVHPSAKGQGILAGAAVQAINAQYKLAIQ